MKHLKYKYLELVLKCLKLEEKDYLFVSIESFLEDEIKIIKDIVKNKYNIKDIYFYKINSFKKHEILLNIDQENINKHPMFDHAIFNKYAKLDASFLFVQSMIPNLMNDIEPKKIKDTALYTRSTEKYFRSLYENNKLNWIIIGIPNKYWAKGMNITLNELWELIFKVCLVDEESDPYINWISKLSDLKKKADILNEYHFDYLEYKNKLGTNLKVYLPKKHIWESGLNDKGIICNLPTEEVFTSPQYNKTEGIVYSSKPLLYNNIMIKDFYLKFKDGKVIEFDAKVGKDTLKNIINLDNNSCYLGECALVSYNSPISNTNTLFLETLYDENASCHLALGRGFSECLKNGDKINNNEELLKEGVNVSNTHVDFMIGTSDLSIIGVTKDKKKIKIFDNGNFVI